MLIQVGITRRGRLVDAHRASAFLSFESIDGDRFLLCLSGFCLSSGRVERSQSRRLPLLVAAIACSGESADDDNWSSDDGKEEERTSLSLEEVQWVWRQDGYAHVLKGALSTGAYL